MASLASTLLRSAILINFYLLFSTMRDLDSAMSTLRSHGYNLMGNSLTVSGLSLRILTNSSSTGLTFLAPPNSALNTSLRLYLIPRRLSYSDLRRLSLSSSPYLQTLVAGHRLSVASSGDAVSIDGVRVSAPDLFLRSRIAIHGLDGVFAQGLNMPPLQFSNQEVQGVNSFSTPPVDAFSPQAERFPSPLPVQFSDNFSANCSSRNQEVLYSNVWPPNSPGLISSQTWCL